MTIEELNEKLREKTLTIQASSQKVEVLQAQLIGSQKRATQQAQEIAQLEALIAEKDLEIQSFSAEVRVQYPGTSI